MLFTSNHHLLFQAQQIGNLSQNVGVIVDSGRYGAQLDIPCSSGDSRQNDLMQTDVSFRAGSAAPH